MTALDENRAKTQLAKKAGVDVTAITNLAIWGNHSATMYPDFLQHANLRPDGSVRHQGRGEWLKGNSSRIDSTARRGHHQGARL